MNTGKERYLCKEGRVESVDYGRLKGVEEKF